MPYESHNDPKLPRNVRESPAKTRRQWLHVYNGASEAGDDDGKAIRKANGVIKRGNAGKSLDWDDAHQVFNRQVSKGDAAYTALGGLTGGEACANCQWFVSPDGCILVSGDIVPTGKSKFWTAEEVWEPEPMRVIVVEDEDSEKGKERSEWRLGSVVREVMEGLGLKVNATIPPPAAGLPLTPADRPTLYASSTPLPDGNRFLATKDAETGLPRLTFWVSNNFRDRDNPPEILSAAAHQDFVRWAGEKDYHPEAWLWHTPGTRWGQVDWMDYADGFLIESVLADKGMEHVAEALAADPTIRVSHGYVIPVGGRSLDDFSVLTQYRQYEISPLPAGKEANELTGLAAYSPAPTSPLAPWDLTPLLHPPHPDGETPPDSDIANGVTAMPMSTEKRQWLEAKLGKERVDALEQHTLQLAEVAKALGLETKDLAGAFAGEPGPTPAPVPDPAPVPEPSLPVAAAPALDVATVVKAIEDKLQLPALNALLTEMRDRLTAVEQSKEKAVAEAIRPAAESVQYMWGKAATRSDANTLTKEQSAALGTPTTDDDHLPPHMKGLAQLITPVQAGPNGMGHSGPNDALSH